MSPQPPAAAGPPRRLSLSQILELVLSRSGGERSSVSLTRNAKGETQIDVVVRTSDDGAVPNVEAAAAKAHAVYDQLCALYPTTSGLVRN